MAGGVFVFKDQQTLVAMQPASFAAEDDFQRLLAEFPSLLSGDQIDATSPRRWVLISREKTIPSQDGGTARWAVDHLFIDQDSVPTLVEVKRQTDTRLRREVVGQMLDYAANAVVYWPVEELRAEFEDSCAARNVDPDEEIRKCLNFDGDVEAFWQRVKTNLQAGRIRLLFVADQIPSELRRVVEFLNEQMDPAEVLALELRQYQGEGLKTLVPILYGQTQEAQQKKGAGPLPKQWTEQEIYDGLQRRFGADIVEVARKIGTWMRQNGIDVSFGRGTKDGSMRAVFGHKGQKLYPLTIWTYGRVEVGFQTMMNSPFRDEEKRRELLGRLNEIPGLNLPDDAITRYPSISLKLLSDETHLMKFFDAMNWFVAELRTS